MMETPRRLYESWRTGDMKTRATNSIHALTNFYNNNNKTKTKQKNKKKKKHQRK